jgi:hypothetical protein
MILNEGGNVFATATPFDHKDVPAILNTVNGALEGTGIRAIPVGSAATPSPGKMSGDMDVIVDEQDVLNFFKAKDAKSGRKALNDYLASKGLETAQSGINVHVLVPVGQEGHQVDIMVTAKAERVSKFHTHDIPQGSPYKGVNKQLMMAILAKSKGYMWSAWQGLFDRNAEGKKGEFVTDELDGVAQLLLGNNATAKDLGSVESILNAMPKDQADALLARAKEDPNWKEVAKEDQQLSRMKQLAGLKEDQVQDLGNGAKKVTKPDGSYEISDGSGTKVYNAQGKLIKTTSPNFGGVSKSVDQTTGATTTNYSAGPMSASRQVDAQGKPIKTTANYDLGVAKLGAEQDHVSGIKTTTATPADPNADPNELLPTKNIAAARGVDPKKFAKFQSRNSAAKEELDAMLTIAKLR